MANLKDCLQSAIDGKAVNPQKAKAAQAEFADLAAKYREAMPPAAADAAAAADILKANIRAKTSRRHAVLAQLQTARRNTAIVAQAADPARAAVDTVESIRFERDALLRQTHGAIAAFLRATGKNLLGQVRNRARVMNVVRELHGEASGDAAAKAFAEAIRAQQTRLRQLFNAHGGDIGEIADFGLPHSHDAMKIRAAGREAWKASVRDRLDWSRIENRAGQPFGSSRAPGAEAFLDTIYERVTTRGWSDRAPSMQAGGKALYNRRAEARVLHFRNADEWMAYNAEFGAEQVFDAMLGHLSGMARDVALMRGLGPNPRAGLEHLIQSAQEKASLAGAADPKAKLEGRTEKLAARARAMLGHMDGSANAPADHAWAAFFAGTRNVLTAAQLGSAMLSSATDLWSMRMAARAVGMHGKNVLARSVSLIAKTTRDEAAAMGYVAETLADAGSASARYLGDVWSPEVTARLSNFVMRASFLSAWTDFNRIAFQMEFSAHLASQAGKAFGEIDPLLRGSLERNGITEADWAALTAEPDALFTAHNGGRFLSSRYWLETQTRLPRAEAEGLSIRLQAAIEREMEFAIPSVSLEGRSAIIGEAAPGTIGGELLRSTAMYKNYAVSLTLNQYRRTKAQPTGMARAKYAATLIGGFTLLGAVSVQLKELSKGRDPRPMDNPRFWGAAFLQGGGVGIFGDFLSAETSRAGGGLAETIAGPVAGVAGDVIRAGASNAQRLAEGKDPLIGRDIANLARRYTPGTSLWYGRLGLDRLVWDELQRFLDPEAERQWRAAERRRAKANGNRSYWEAGDPAPARAPDLSNALGDLR